MLAGRRFRVEFTPEQAEYADRIGAACRAVWNTGLEQRREYRRRDAWASFALQSSELTEARAANAWLAEAPRDCLVQALLDLDGACRRRGTFRVHWRSGRQWLPSFRFPKGSKMTVQGLNRRHGRINLPKLGWVKFRLTHSLGAEIIRSATLTREGRHWSISLLVDDGIETPGTHHNVESAIGIDRGVSTAIATSDGKLIDRGFIAKGEARRSLNLQRKLARCKRGGENRKRARRDFATLRRRERNRRKDFCAQSASRLAQESALVVLEDLDIQKMTKSAKRKPELNRAVMSKGWGIFEQCLHSSARYTGTQIIKVNPAYTSQRCSQCQHVDPESRESQAVFRCTNCKHSEHADVNAAKNILAAGLAVTACGDFLPLGTSTKQEPAGTRK